MPHESRIPTSLAPRIRLWLLRLLVRANALDGWKNRNCMDEDVVAALGYPESRRKPSRRKLVRDLAAAEASVIEPTSVLESNVQAFGEALGLDDAERDLLVFAVASQLSSDISDCIGPIRRREVLSTQFIAATALARPLGDIVRALAPTATLSSTRLVRPTHGFSMRGALFDIPEHIAALLATGDSDASAIVAEWVRIAPASALGRADFAHLGDDLDLVCRRVRGAIAESAPGINVLLWGPPGTGKTELARVIGAEVGSAVYEVAAGKADGTWTGGTARLATFATAQRLLGSRGASVLVMDEVEDVFPSLTEFEAKPADKAWVHQQLENNRLPAIWISNTIEGLDPAHLRRFSLVLEVPVPPVEVRRRLLAEAVKGLPVGTGFVAKVASDPRVAPAHVKRAASVVRLAGVSDAAQVERTVSRVIDQAFAGRASGLAPRAPRAVGEYDLTAVRADVDLDKLVASLARKPAGAVCLYGPPGTGKTAFAHHLAERVGLPLRIERASDLLSKFLGDTEKHIAEMFRRARHGRTVLLLDEADSFLRSRTTAERSWEVTQVNELLVQMEQFDGLFLCATNLLDTIDEAALRRFGVKIAFDYPAPPARWELFRRALAATGGLLPDAPAVVGRLRGRLDAMDRLTPGDFAAVIRRATMLDEQYEPGRLVDALAAELAVKPGAAARRVGFRA